MTTHVSGLVTAAMMPAVNALFLAARRGAGGGSASAGVFDWRQRCGGGWIMVKMNYMQTRHSAEFEKTPI